MNKKIKLVSLICFVLSFFIILGNLIGFNQNSSFNDFVDLYRPILWLSCILLGGLLSVKSDCAIERLLFTFIILSIISGIVAVLEKIGFDIFYIIYSGGNHIVSNRATGIAQDFADYSLIQAIGITSAYFFFKERKSLKYLTLMFFLSFSILLSTSKSGLVLLMLVLVYLFFDMLSSGIIAVKYKLALFFLLGLFLALGVNWILTNDKFYNEISDLISYDTTLPSLSNRLDDFYFVVNQSFENFSFGTFFGFGADKSNVDAYIEVAILSNIYRVGLLGTFFYYLIFIWIYKNISRVKSLAHFKIIIFSMIFIDVFAAMTNRLIGVSLVMLLVGMVISRNDGKGKLYK